VRLNLLPIFEYYIFADESNSIAKKRLGDFSDYAKRNPGILVDLITLDIYKSFKSQNVTIEETATMMKKFEEFFNAWNEHTKLFDLSINSGWLMGGFSGGNYYNMPQYFLVDVLPNENLPRFSPWKPSWSVFSSLTQQSVNGATGRCPFGHG
ncbi:MAG: hypothetical protein SFU25_11815, partial [Candidatus Caenarcaniphilales bacterium]|nr:hypothetical protein [Candidatus Caenarcaniphilales bacterium]